MFLISTVILLGSFFLGQVTDNDPLRSLNLASISGVLAATMFVVEILKRLFKNAAFFSKVPVFVYAGAVAVILAFTANKIPTSDGSHLLEGSTFKVLWAALIAALGSSGFYTWLRKPEAVEDSSVSTSTTNLPVWLGLTALFVISGCASDKIAVREGLANSSTSMWNDHVDWATKLTVDPATGKDARDQLPKLSENDLKAVKAAKAQYDALLSEDRAKDGASLLGK